MSLDFYPLTADAIEEVTSYARLRGILTSEGQFMNQFIWSNYYKTAFHKNGRFLFYKMNINHEPATMFPLCRKEDIVSSFFEIKDYFNSELNLPLKMYIVDEDTLEVLKTSEQFLKEFTFTEDRDCFDYIYDAEKLKKLSGKAYHKKKNHLNSFIKNFDGRFEYRTLCCKDADAIKEFHEKWLDKREITGRRQTIKSEEIGVDNIFNYCSVLDCKLGGIYVDGRLEAYSIGSYNPLTKCAYIHIEKANITMNGLYNYINQQFLIHEFPDAVLVNREDDLGQEGLRKSKLSYHPAFMAKKYNVFQN